MNHYRMNAQIDRNLFTDKGNWYAGAAAVCGCAAVFVGLLALALAYFDVLFY